MPKNFYPDMIYYFNTPMTSRISLKPEFKVERRVMRQLESDDSENKYITKEHQAPYIVDYQEDDHIFVDVNDEPMDDEYNFVLICEEPPLLLCSPTLHHSYLANGKKVLGAGTLIFDQGELKTITNNSGHYRPADNEMLPLVKALHTACNGTLIKYKSYCNVTIETYPVVELISANDFNEITPISINEEIIPVSGLRVKTGYDNSISSIFDNHRYGKNLRPELNNKYSAFLQTGNSLFNPAEDRENIEDVRTEEFICEKITNILLLT
jgi:hypothetical protein